MLHEPHIILAVHITDRLKEAVEVQKHLTSYGRFIRTRLGLHELEKLHDGPSGLLLLEMAGPDTKAKELADQLNAIPGVEVKSIVFEHPAR